MFFSVDCTPSQCRRDVLAGVAACVLCLAGASPQTFAATASGVLDVRLQLEPGCEFGFGATAGEGLLDFGRADGVGENEAQARGDDVRAVAAIRIACSSFYTGAGAPVLSIDAGLHARGAQRHLRGPGGELVAYELYADPAHRVPLAPGMPMRLPPSAAGAAAPIPIYGEVPHVGHPAAGFYTDVVSLTLSY